MLSEVVHEKMRLGHYARRTEEAYLGWIRRFLIFHKQGEQWRHPKELGGPEGQRFLSHLATERKVAASTQNQALNALRFFYKSVLKVPVGKLEGVRAGVDKRARSWW